MSMHNVINYVGIVLGLLCAIYGIIGREPIAKATFRTMKPWKRLGYIVFGLFMSIGSWDVLRPK